MQPTYAWIFTTGIVVFFLVVIFLLCFTKSAIELPLSFNGDLDIPRDSEEAVFNLTEDARLSYERAKSIEENTINLLHTYRLFRLAGTLSS
jgi:hypothetical protein